MAIRTTAERSALITELRQRLTTARLELARTVALTDDELATLEAHQAGEFAGNAATSVVSDVLSRLDGQARHELDEIDEAQARLEAGRFGVCECCHGAIPLARLRAIPTARYCVACQVENETGRAERARRRA